MTIFRPGLTFRASPARPVLRKQLESIYMKSAITLATALLLALPAGAADGVAVQAKASRATVQVEAHGAWARATVGAQSASGAFLSLRANQDVRLLGASSTAAERVELHQMTMQGDRMQMGEVDGLDLPAGKMVALDGAHHFMLMGLKRQLRAGEKIDLTLEFKAKGSQRRERITVQVPVQPITYAPPKSAPHSRH
jgi:hypothetical protein